MSESAVEEILTVLNRRAMINEAAAAAPGCMSQDVSEQLETALEDRSTLVVATSAGEQLGCFVLRDATRDDPAVTLFVTERERDLRRNAGILYDAYGISGPARTDKA